MQYFDMENSSPWEKLTLKCLNFRKVWKSKSAEEPKFVSLEDTVTQKEGISELGHIETYPKYLWLTESSTLTHSVVKVASHLQNWSCNWPTIVALEL
jgi:hypothetical protein